ncbi:MAG TPA: TraR/DksA C4-type zinc finger protein [Ktedonobacterales bacterium]
MKSTLPLPIIEELRMRLECDRDRLMEQIAGLRAAEGANRPQKSVTWGKEVTDQADQGMDQAEWDRLHIEELALADRLAEVAHALAKIPLGAYGLCEACGQPIPEARLQELPAARFDLEHEVAFESRIHAQEQLPEPGF